MQEILSSIFTWVLWRVFPACELLYNFYFNLFFLFFLFNLTFGSSPIREVTSYYSTPLWEERWGEVVRQRAEGEEAYPFCTLIIRREISSLSWNELYAGLPIILLISSFKQGKCFSKCLANKERET